MSKVTKKDYENENFLTILNYVETTEPDYIAKDIEQKDKRIAELEKELAELKEKAIFPKFKIGQFVWVIGFIENKHGIFQEPLQKVVTGIMQRINDFIYDIHGEIYLEKELFATKAEAEKALKERIENACRKAKGEICRF